MGWYVYVVAAVLVAVALVIGRPRPRNSLRARDMSNANVHVGDSSGPTSQTVTPAAPAGPREAKPDRIAWAIGIIAVLVALAQLGHDVLAK
jgi:hypothetical protein